MSKSPYWLFVALVLVLAGLQYRLWVGEGSLAQVNELKREIDDQKGENERLLERNRILEAEVLGVGDTLVHGGERAAVVEVRGVDRVTAGSDLVGERAHAVRETEGVVEEDDLRHGSERRPR